MGKRAVFKLFYCISIVATFLLAGVTLAGAFSGYMSPSRCIGFAFIGVALPVLLLINLIVLLYWTVRLRIWALIPLIAILGNWSYLSRIVQFSSPDTAAPAPTLTLATYNVDTFNRDQTGYSCKEIAGFMEEQGVDVLCMQEFGGNREFNVDSIKKTLAAWSYYSIPKTIDGTPLLQVALFSKFPILNTELVTYPDSRNCSMQCDINVNGKTIRVFNNHLQTTEVSRNKRVLEKELSTENVTRTEHAAQKLAVGMKENFVKRGAQAEKIKELIDASPYPTLVCGDFNSLPSSYTYHTLKGDKLKDGFETCGHGYMYTFRFFKRLLRIDYILHTKEFEGVDYFSPDVDYSDHKPVVMRMRI